MRKSSLDTKTGRLRLAEEKDIYVISKYLPTKYFLIKRELMTL